MGGHWVVYCTFDNKMSGILTVNDFISTTQRFYNFKIIVCALRLFVDLVVPLRQV